MRFCFSAGKLLIPFAAAVILSIAPYRTVAAQEKNDLQSREAAKKVCEVFLQSLAKNDTKRAFNSIKPYISIPDKEFNEVIEEVVRQRDTLVKRFGNSQSYEFLQEQTLKDILLKYTYIEKYQIHVIRWSFIFYKPQDKWTLNSFYWDENIKELFK